MNWRPAVLVLTLVVVGQAPANPGGAAGLQPEQDALEQTLRAIDGRARGIRDLTADFQQLKHTAMLKRPMQSHGTVRLIASGHQARMRWDTAKPHPTTLAMTDTEIQMYYPRQALLEIYPVESELAKLAASPLPRLEFVRRHFTIESMQWEGLEASQAAGHIALRLTPKEEKLREHVVEVHVLIEETTACITRAVVQYPDQERLELSFADIKINTGLKESDVELTVPAGTKVSRPLEPGVNGEPK